MDEFGVDDRDDEEPSPVDSAFLFTAFWGQTWAQAVDSLGAKLLGQPPKAWEVSMFILAVNALEKSMSVAERLFGPDPLLSELRTETSQIVAHGTKARNAIAHFDEWALGLGRGQPWTVAGFAPLFPGIEKGDVVLRGVEKSRGELHPYVSEDARMPIEPLRVVARRFATAVWAAHKRTARELEDG